MDINHAKNISRKYIMKFMFIGASIAIIFMSVLHSLKGIDHMFDWFVDHPPPILFGVAGLFIGAYFSGGLVGRMMLNKRNPELSGILSAFLVIWTSIFITSIYMVVESSLNHPQSFLSNLESYVLKPFYWITIFGTIPAVVLGAIAGSRINKKINNIANSK